MHNFYDNTIKVNHFGQSLSGIEIVVHRIESKPAANMGLVSGKPTCKHPVLCPYSSSMLIDTFVLQIPPEQKAPNHYTY